MESRCWKSELIQFRLQKKKCESDESAFDMFTPETTLRSWILIFKWLNDGLRKVGGFRRGGGGGSDVRLAAPVHALVTVGDVEEEVLLVMLLRRTIRWLAMFEWIQHEAERTLNQRETRWCPPPLAEGFKQWMFVVYEMFSWTGTEQRMWVNLNVFWCSIFK